MRNGFSVLLGWLGAFALVIGSAAPWFQVPQATSNDFGLTFAVAAREAPASIAFRALCLMAGLAVIAYQMRGAPERRWIGAGSAALLALLLLFPHAVMIWCPVTSAEATWLHLQHKSLTWFGGDVFGLQEIKELAWKDRVYASDLLDQATSTSTPSWFPTAVPFGSLSDLAQWFGYSNTYCQFVRPGWGISLAGAMIVLLSAGKKEGRADAGVVRAAIVAASAVLGVGVAGACMSAAFSALELDRARAAAERGLPELAIERMDLATRLVPVLGQSSDLALQRGLLESRLGRDTPRASLYRAKVLSASGMTDEAESILGTIVVTDLATGSVRREALRGLLRRGIRQLNSGENARAVQSLETVLRADPCNLKGNYVLQLGYLRARRFDSLRELGVRMRETYRYFGDETKLPVLAATQENAAYAAFLEDNPVAAHALWKTLGDTRALRQR
jgi:hypothetical protein